MCKQRSRQQHAVDPADGLATIEVVAHREGEQLPWCLDGMATWSQFEPMGDPICGFGGTGPPAQLPQVIECMDFVWMPSADGCI